MFSSKPSKIGVIGLGIVGSRISEVLRKNGLHVYVWNRSPKQVENFASSPAEVAELAQVVQLFVRNGKDVLEVIDGMKRALTKKHTVISHATISPEDARKAAEAVAATGAAFLEAPFTGSKVAAENGQLVYYVCGDKNVLQKARSVLERSSKEIFHAGDKIGTAAVLKIVTNMVTSTTGAILAEALSVARTHGIDPEQLTEAFKSNACHSPLVDMKLPTMAKGDFDPHFSLRNMFKDAQFGLALGSDKNLELPVLSTVAGVMFNAMRAGHEEEDFSVVLTNYQPSKHKSPANTSQAPKEPDTKPAPTPSKKTGRIAVKPSEEPSLPIPVKTTPAGAAGPPRTREEKPDDLPPPPESDPDHPQPENDTTTTPAEKQPRPSKLPPPRAEGKAPPKLVPAPSPTGATPAAAAQGPPASTNPEPEPEPEPAEEPEQEIDPKPEPAEPKAKAKAKTEPKTEPDPKKAESPPASPPDSSYEGKDQKEVEDPW